MENNLSSYLLLFLLKGQFYHSENQLYNIAISELGCDLVLILISLSLDHLPGHLEGGQEASELYFLAGARHQSALQLGQLDQQVDLHLGRQLQSVHVEVDLGEDVLQAQT